MSRLIFIALIWLAVIYVGCMAPPDSGQGEVVGEPPPVTVEVIPLPEPPVVKVPVIELPTPAPIAVAAPPQHFSGGVTETDAGSGTIIGGGAAAGFIKLPVPKQHISGN